MDSEPEFTIPTATEAGVIKKYLQVETEFMAAEAFFTHSRNALIRSHAVSIIATHSHDPDAYIPYLAMNYFDRYFSTIQFQNVQDLRSDSERVRLIALCCLFLSAKMRTKTFSVDLFLRDESINFTHKRIMEMELNILDVLHWRMRPVTAFMYLNYYYRYFRSLGGFKRRCINEIIVQAQGENQFVSYKPSQIAMSAFLVAAEIAYPSEFKNLHYQEEDLSECVRDLGDLCDRKSIKIEPGKSENLSTSSKIEVDSSEEVEDETERLIRRTRDKGKEVSLALEPGIAQGEAEEPSSEEQIATITDEIDNKTHPEVGSSGRDIVEDTKEEIEVIEEEKRRLAKGKAVAVFKTSNEEKRRLAKGKEVVVSETSDEERQRLLPKSKSEKDTKKLDKKEQEKSIADVVTTIKVGMVMGKVKIGARDGGSSKLEIVNEPEKLMNFDLKWVTNVPSLEDGESQTALSEALAVSVQIPAITVQGEGSCTAENKIDCANCIII